MLKKSLIAAAVLSTLGSAAMAQSNVTIYGIADASVARIDNGSETRWRLDSGRNAASRFGVRGNEDLGGGLKALFLLESQMDLSSGETETGQFWSRLAYVGLEGSFGGVRLGRQDSPMRTALNVIDPFQNAGMAGSIDYFGYTESVGGVTTMERVSNQATYILPGNLGGLNGSVAYVFGEQNSTKPGSAWAANVGYAAGGLALQAAYSRQNAGAGYVTDVILGGTYDFGFLKFHLGAHKTDSDDGFTTPELDVMSYLVGFTVPLGDALKLRAWYIKNSVDEIPNADSQMAAISLTYALSKRTQLYTTYVKVDNDAVSRMAVIRTPGGAGTTNDGIAVGVQHNF